MYEAKLIIYKVILCITTYFIYKDVTLMLNTIKYSPLLVDGQLCVSYSAAPGTQDTLGPCLAPCWGLFTVRTIIFVWAFEPSEVSHSSIKGKFGRMSQVCNLGELEHICKFKIDSDRVNPSPSRNEYPGHWVNQ